MRIDITYTDDTASARFVEGTAGVWGLYGGTREAVNGWLLAGRSRMEARWAEVAGVDLAVSGHVGWNLVRDTNEATYRWIVEECPLPALAIMCAEWGAP